jgi:hypothetical protein
LRWGLVPYRAKDIKVGFANINAKAEGIEGKPAFREAFQRRRCLVPVDNFYEWAKTAAGKQPYALALAGRDLMALAGLWENWRSPAGEWMRSFAIVTTTTNELCARLHNRMPVVLKPEAWPVWSARPDTPPPEERGSETEGIFDTARGRPAHRLGTEAGALWSTTPGSFKISSATARSNRQSDIPNSPPRGWLGSGKTNSKSSSQRNCIA